MAMRRPVGIGSAPDGEVARQRPGTTHRMCLRRIPRRRTDHGLGFKVTMKPFWRWPSAILDQLQLAPCASVSLPV